MFLQRNLKLNPQIKSTKNIGSQRNLFPSQEEQKISKCKKCLR